MATVEETLAQAEAMLKEGKHFDGVQRINKAFELMEPQLGGEGLKILKEPAAFLAEVIDRLSPEQKALMRKMYQVRGDLLFAIGAAKRAVIEYSCVETLDPDDGEVKAKKAKVEAELSGKAETDTHKIPATVLTGFLGSGKTTLLNHILRENHGKRLAVIENEFGEVGIDDALVKGGTRADTEFIVEMNNGCICCTVRGDLIAGLKKLIKQSKKSGQKLDGVLIETTGLADPAPVAQTFFADDFVQQHMRLDGILTMVDAKHLIQHLDDEKPEGVENEAVEQIAFADRIMLNKCDLASAEELKEVERRIRMINATVPLRRCTNSLVDMDYIIGIRGFSLDKIIETDDQFLKDEHDHQHDDRVTSVGVDVPGEVNGQKLNDWISWLLKEKGTDIFRSKGILAVQGVKEKFVFQAIHMIFSNSREGEWAEGETRRCKMIFIGKNLNRAELTEGFMACMAK